MKVRARSCRPLLLAALAPIVGCWSSGTPTAASSVATTTPTSIVASSIVASTTAAAVDASGPLHRMERVTLGATTLDVAIVVPDGFHDGDVRPVLVALPPGGQDRDTTEKVVDGRWAPEARRRGWVVLSPVAPGTGLFYEPASAALIPALVDALAARFPAEGGKPHLAGISNGGLSAFRVALDHPDRFASLTVLPGYPPEATDAGHLGSLAAMPVALFVGGDDSGWRESSEQTAASLRALGGTVTLDVVAGDDHFLRHLAAATVFDRLDASRRR